MTDSVFDLSVLVVCYNAEKYIERCLDSIIGQKTTLNIQVVVMDDCSKDKSFQKITDFAIQDFSDRICFSVFQQPTNKGCYVNMMDGLSRCEGLKIAYMEGDDYWLDANKLQTQYDFLLNNLQFSGIGTGCQFVNKNGIPTNQPYYTGTKPRIYDYQHAWLYPKFQTSSFLFVNERKLAFHSNLAFSECNDKILIEHLTQNKPIYYDPAETTAYRVHSENITSKRSKSSIYLHHIRVNAILLKNTGIKNLHFFIYSFLVLTYIWLNDIVKSR